MTGKTNHELESRLPGEINNLICEDNTALMAESKDGLKSLLIRVKEENGKAGFKPNIKNN